MSALAGAVGRQPKEALARLCSESLQRQSAYASKPPKQECADGGCLGSALFPVTPWDVNDQQPLRSGPFILTADARVDNRADILGALGGSICSEISHSELILAGWLRWRCDVFTRLVGSFAVAVFDTQSRKVVLARSPTFDRPLCYRIDRGLFRFASMPSGLLNGQFSSDTAAVAKLIVNGDMECGETAFAAIKQVLPGHYLEWSPTACRVQRFWHPPDVDEHYAGNPSDDLIHWLELAVGARLSRAQGRVATHLSSGFDSSAVTATAARLIADPRDLLAFTGAPCRELPWSAPTNVVADESAVAAEIAKRLSIEHRTISEAGPLLDHLKGHARYFQSPHPNLPNAGWGEAIDREASQAGATVLLSATRGNANISYGNVDVLAEWLRERRLADYVREIRKLVRSGNARWRGAIFYSIFDYVPCNIWNRLAGFDRGSAKSLFIRPEWLSIASSQHERHADAMRKVRQHQYNIFVNGDVGLYTKGTLARFGIDERDPTADIRLAEFALRLPAQQFLSNGMTRRLARTALSDRLPQSVLDQRQRGYQGADWFAKLRMRDASNWIEEISASHSANEILDFSELRRSLSQWPQIAALPAHQQREWGNRFTRALAVGAFLRECELDIGILGS